MPRHRHRVATAGAALAASASPAAHTSVDPRGKIFMGEYWPDALDCEPVPNFKDIEGWSRRRGRPAAGVDGVQRRIVVRARDGSSTPRAVFWVHHRRVRREWTFGRRQVRRDGFTSGTRVRRAQSRTILGDDEGRRRHQSRGRHRRETTVVVSCTWVIRVIAPPSPRWRAARTLWCTNRRSTRKK